VDPGPVDLLNGAAAYNATPISPATGPTQVQQPVNGSGTPGNAYLFQVTAPTSNPQKVLVRYAILPMRG
jgi:hypothetical protein